MQKKSLVSIVTGVFNGQGTLEECHRSVIDQTYDNFEWLVVDDRSTDNSFDIISNWKDARIRVLQTASNTGSAAAPRNIAIAKSKGDYIAILDQDDLWYADKLKRQIEFMEIHEDIGLFSSNLIAVGDHKQKDLHFCIKKPGLIYPRPDDVYRENPFLSSATIIRRHTIEDVGGFDEHQELHGLSDVELAIRVSLKYRTAFNGNHIAGVYRLHHSNISRSVLSFIRMEYIRNKHDQNFSDSLVRDVRARDCYNNARYALNSGAMAIFDEQISKAASYRSHYRWKGLFLKYKNWFGFADHR